jgi:hypothetical protein
MTIRPVMLLLFLVIGCGFAFGDTLILKNGQKLEGRYLSSADNSVVFEVGGKPFTYSTWLISEIQFHSVRSQPSSQQTPYTGPRGKQQQDQFCGVLTNFLRARNKASSEPNPIRRAQMHPRDPWSFEDSITHVFGPNGEFVDWTGHLFFSVSGSDVVFTFQPACRPGSSVTFTNGYPVDQRNEARTARISLSSPLAQKLRDAPPGGIYSVSGHLFPRNKDMNSRRQTDSRQRFEGAQPNGVANVTNPQYLVQFTDVTPAGR